MRLRVWEPDIASLRSRIEDDEINLQPDFQRNEVWNAQKKRKLIDTILREWTIPPIHLIERNAELLEVLDGQQRLSAIMDFYNGNLTIDGNIFPFDPIVSSLDKMTYSRLPTDARRRFDRFTLRVVNIYDFQPEEPGELFYRLNEGIKLTPAEQRNALFGPIRDQVKYLVNYFADIGLNRDSIGFSNSRMAYEDVIARCLFALERQSIYSSFSDAEISNRFRSPNEIDAQAFHLLHVGVKRFGVNSEVLGGIKLNKSTLFSLILFYCFAETSADDVELAWELSMLGQKDWIEFSEFRFEDSEYSFSSSDIPFHIMKRFLTSIHDIYRDRASLRVNDAASVVSRDICLWLYAYLRRGTVAHTHIRQVICSHLIDEFVHRNEAEFLSTIFNKRLLSDWGTLS